jgi:hypothetical protein
MIFYHRTTAANATKILRKGFRDSTGYYGFSRPKTGVWISNVPLDINEGASGDVLLRIDMPERIARKYEWMEDGKHYREWLMPAQLINKHAKVSIQDEVGKPASLP